MKHVTTRLPKDIYDKVVLSAKSQNIPFCSYLRKLICLGLDIEEHEQKMSQNPNPSEQQNLTKKINKSIIENLIISRYLLKNSNKNLSDDEIYSILSSAKAKAEETVH